MKKILLFGAGKSATVLINYLSNLVVEKNWGLTVADNNAQLLKQKVNTNQFVQTVVLNIEDEEVRKSLITKSDLVISMMPPQLHYLIAIDCLHNQKHLLTASYVDEKLKSYNQEITEKGLLFLCEMGLDPGIDHMSAMKIIDDLKQQGANITSFKSHCGGLVAPESDDNPWHYKISWNPKNIILAGKAGAIFKENNQVVQVPYQELFNPRNLIHTKDGDTYAYYPNRDSLSYIDLYNLEKASTFLRTTLRHPDFLIGWKYIVDMQLTNEEKIYDTNDLSIYSFFKEHSQKYHLDHWFLLLANYKNPHFTKLDPEQIIFLNQLNYLDITSNQIINKGVCSAADILQFILEDKLQLKQTDKDLVVMIHEIEYTINEIKSTITSTLTITGNDSNETAMAKTVGLPLGIAAKLILENKIDLVGLQIPTDAKIYNPVLKELAQYGIYFKENVE